MRGTVEDRSRVLIERTRIARKTAGISVKIMAAALGISAKRYRHFERDIEIPVTLVLAFCSMARCSPRFLATGERMPLATQIVIAKHGNLLAPQNLCGAPCPIGSHWCRAECMAKADEAPTCSA